MYLEDEKAMSEGISYLELLQRLQVSTVAEKTAYDAYLKNEERIWREDLDRSPHGRPWHTSFHASSFPGDPDTACARKALYGLMDLPNDKPIDQQGRGIMDAGKALEERYVWNYEDAGYLLSARPDAKRQTGFSLPEFWLSGNLDAVIRPEGWNRGHVVEFKGKDHDKIDAMRRGEIKYHFEHYFQLQCYIGCLQTESDRVYREYVDRTTQFKDDLATTWLKKKGLNELVKSGSILYFSRQRPRHTMEYYFEFDPELWKRATDFLRDWKQNFLDGELPARNPDWKWMQAPCGFCPVKRICKQDFKDGITKLEDSNAIEFAKKIRPKYDYKEVRKSVLKRWEKYD